MGHARIVTLTHRLHVDCPPRRLRRGLPCYACLTSHAAVLLLWLNVRSLGPRMSRVFLAAPLLALSPGRPWADHGTWSVPPPNQVAPGPGTRRRFWQAPSPCPVPRAWPGCPGCVAEGARFQLPCRESLAVVSPRLLTGPRRRPDWPAHPGEALSLSWFGSSSLVHLLVRSCATSNWTSWPCVWEACIAHAAGGEPAGCPAQASAGRRFAGLSVSSNVRLRNV